MTNPAEGKIAIIEDDPDIAANIQIALMDYGFDCKIFSSAAQFYANINDMKPDLCLVDLGLPDQNGLDVIKKLNESGNIASIIISGRRALTDKIVGLEMGADDYISKPFETAELVARVRTVMRRVSKTRHTNDKARQPSKAKFDNWTLDMVNYTLAHQDGTSTQLSMAEMDIMKMFLEGTNRLFSRAQILDNLKLDPDQNFDRSIDVRISRLRTKLCESTQAPKFIKTVYGGGYMFVANVEWVT
nr:response regulator transcription factor [Ahrensia kielensis]